MMHSRRSQNGNFLGFVPHFHTSGLKALSIPYTWVSPSCLELNSESSSNDASIWCSKIIGRELRERRWGFQLQGRWVWVWWLLGREWGIVIDKNIRRGPRCGKNLLRGLSAGLSRKSALPRVRSSSSGIFPSRSFRLTHWKNKRFLQEFSIPDHLGRVSSTFWDFLGKASAGTTRPLFRQNQTWRASSDDGYGTGSYLSILWPCPCGSWSPSFGDQQLTCWSRSGFLEESRCIAFAQLCSSGTFPSHVSLPSSPSIWLEFLSPGARGGRGRGRTVRSSPTWLRIRCRPKGSSCYGVTKELYLSLTIFLI